MARIYSNNALKVIGKISKEECVMKNSVRLLVTLVATALVVSAPQAHALRVLTEAEKAAVIAEYLAEREAKEAVKAPEPAPEVKPTEVKVVVEAAKTEEKAPEITLKVVKEEAAKAEVEKTEVKAVESTDIAPKEVDGAVGDFGLDGGSAADFKSNESGWGTGPRPAMMDCAVTLEKGVPTVNIPATVEVKGETEKVSVGNDVGIIFPERGQTVSVKQLAAEAVLVPEWQNGKVVVKRLPTFTTWPKGKAYDFSSYSCLRDFLMMRPYGLVVTACGTGNIEEAIRGRPLDNPVRTIAVLENPELDSRGRIHGDRKLYAIAKDGKTVPVSVQHYTDFSSVVYWIQMRVPVAVLGTNKRQVHWRSAKYRAEGTIANDGTSAEPQAFLTLFFGAQEGSEKRVGGKVVGKEGREATIPTHPLVSISQEDAVMALEAYKASLK